MLYYLNKTFLLILIYLLLLALKVKFYSYYFLNLINKINNKCNIQIIKFYYFIKV